MSTEKIFKKIIKNLSAPHLIEYVDLIDFLLSVRDKVNEFDENMRGFQILKDLKETDEEWFYSVSKNELIVIFDQFRNTVHSSGYLIEYFFPDLNKDFFDNISQ